MNQDYKKHRPAQKPNLSFEYAEDKIGIFALMHPRQSSMHFSDSSSTESMKRIEKKDKTRFGLSLNKPRKAKEMKNPVIWTENKEIEDVKKTNLMYAQKRPDRLRQFSYSGLGVDSRDFSEDTDETVIKNFVEMKIGRDLGRGKTKSELSSSMVEIMKVLDKSEQNKEFRKYQTRLQVLKVFKLQGLRMGEERGKYS